MKLDSLMAEPYMILNSGVTAEHYSEPRVLTVDGWSLREFFAPLSGPLWGSGDAVRDTRQEMRGGPR